MARARGESCFFYDDEFGRYAAVAMFGRRVPLYNAFICRITNMFAEGNKKLA